MAVEENHDLPTLADTTADRPFELHTDVDEIGFSTILLTSVPLLRALVQMVAESDGDWNFLNLVAASGAWVGVARRAGEDLLDLSTNHGGRTSERYDAELDEILVTHGFEFNPEHEGYRQFISFDSDVAFTQTALLIIGTFMHAWRTPLKESVGVELQLSLSPTEAAVA